MLNILTIKKNIKSLEDAEKITKQLEDRSIYIANNLYGSYNYNKINQAIIDKDIKLYPIVKEMKTYKDELGWDPNSSVHIINNKECQTSNVEIYYQLKKSDYFYTPLPYTLNIYITSQMGCGNANDIIQAYSIISNILDATLEKEMEYGKDIKDFI